MGPINVGWVFLVRHVRIVQLFGKYDFQNAIPSTVVHVVILFQPKFVNVPCNSLHKYYFLELLHLKFRKYEKKVEI